MDSDHPYRPPASEVGGPPSGWGGGGSGSITPGILEALRKTRPWVLFLGVMILVGSGLMVVLALFMAIVSRFVPAGSSPLPGMGMVPFALLYLLMAALYLYPGIRLLQFAAAIRRIGDTDSAQAIEAALEVQFTFWRFLGIATLAVIGVYLLIIVVGVIVGIGGIATATS